MGGECVGVVTRVGAAVDALAVGDRVVCVPPAGMGSVLVTDKRWVSRAPDGYGMDMYMHRRLLRHLTRAHTHRRRIQEWLREPERGDSLGYLDVWYAFYMYVLVYV